MNRFIAIIAFIIGCLLVHTQSLPLNFIYPFHANADLLKFFIFIVTMLFLALAMLAKPKIIHANSYYILAFFMGVLLKLAHIEDHHIGTVLIGVMALSLIFFAPDLHERNDQRL